jgi:hypothetical protein
VAGPKNSFLQSLGEGAPLPPIDPEDLKRIRDYFQTVRAKLAKAPGLQDGTPEEPRFGVQLNLIAEHCSPGANVEALFFRYSILEMLTRQGLLSPWRHGEEFDDFVFNVFASYPSHLGRSETKLDVEALPQHIREKSREK